ncbi:MAG TPA: glycerophosphodiester phosphodiesterase family protein [bacterium]|nr:glycerophosphodiester phosphodiesterase family protein [bacterium]
MESGKLLLFTASVVGILATGCSRQPARLELPVEITAHRGASGLYPENTLIAINAAIRRGAQYAEIDVQETADGVVVLLHDITLERTTDLTGSIGDVTYSQVQSADAGSWFAAEYQNEPIPTLAQVMDAVRGKIRLNIEIKMDEQQNTLPEKVVNLINEHDFREHCIVTSFDRDAIRRVKTLQPAITTGYIFSELPEEDVFTGECELLSVHYQVVTPDFVARARQSNKAIHAWTVNNLGETHRLIELGVDNIITNYPRYLLQFIQEPLFVDEGLAAYSGGDYLTRPTSRVYRISYRYFIPG